MKRTPDAISKARQEAGREIRIWRAGIREACSGLQLTADSEAKIALCKGQIAACQKKIAETLCKGKREFWTK
jgi:hypothetical protein